MPVITVSRMYGSGGSEIAQRVAASLDWKLYDNAVVDAVAARLRLTPADVSAIEERVPSLAQRIASALSLGSPEVLPPPPEGGLTLSEERVVEATRAVIEEAVQQGPCVVVGRGTQCLLSSRADAIHVFCVAPHRALVRRTVETTGLSPAEADRKVCEMNHQRELYVKRHWQRDWRNPQNYHLCLDTEWFGIEGTAEVIVRFARQRLLGATRRSGA